MLINSILIIYYPENLPNLILHRKNPRMRKADFIVMVQLKYKKLY